MATDNKHPASDPSGREHDKAPHSHTAHTHEHEHGHSHEHAHEHTQRRDDTHTHSHSHVHEHRACRKKSGTAITVRAISGLSGDMMLSGLASLAELGPGDIEKLVMELKLPALEGCLTIEARSVNHIAGVGCSISLPHEHAHRTLKDIEALIAASAMPDEAKQLSARTFAFLAKAEAAVHGTVREEVTFHEVGALDSILDICLVARLFTLLNPARFICSPLPLADGAVFCAHGCIPSPAPAVLRMLNGVPVCGFSGEGETVTPTALALLKSMHAEFGPWPEMVVEKTVISYGDKVFKNAPNGAVWAAGTLG